VYVWVHRQAREAFPPKVSARESTDSHLAQMLPIAAGAGGGLGSGSGVALGALGHGLGAALGALGGGLDCGLAGGLATLCGGGWAVPWAMLCRLAEASGGGGTLGWPSLGVQAAKGTAGLAAGLSTAAGAALGSLCCCDARAKKVPMEYLAATGTPCESLSVLLAAFCSVPHTPRLCERAECADRTRTAVWR
jgi:hypothetical protein